MRIACTDPQATQVAIPMRKGEEAASFREAVDQAIRELKESGELGEISVKYFGTDITRE